MFKFPWGDMHSLNLGWFLQKFNELREDWATAEAGIDGALDAEIQRAEDALSDVFDARDAAAASATAAAGSATAAGTSATAAQNSATAAASSATLANNKATAAGLSEAAAAQSASASAGSATNAANSATSASQSATAAGNSATTAGQQATNAAGSATAAANSATAAAASAQSVEDENLISEGFAVGEQNGVPVTDGPYYQNNAKYYASLLGNVRPSMGDTILDEIMPSTAKSTPQYSGRRVSVMGRRVEVTRSAGGSAYRKYVLNGDSINTYPDAATGADLYAAGEFSPFRGIRTPSAISLFCWGDIENIINTSVNLYVYTTGDGGTTLHVARINNTIDPFSGARAFVLPFTQEMISDLSTSENPEICIILTLRSGYDSARSTMAATLALKIT